MSLRWNSTITGLILETDMIHMSEAPNISALLELAGTNTKTLFVVKEFPIKENATIPSNIAVVVNRNGVFNIDTGKMLTINGPLFAGSYKIFSGDGTAKLNHRAADFVRPEWWGAVYDGTTNDSAAIASAKASIDVGNALLIQPSASGDDVVIEPIGEDTDISVQLLAKGSGQVRIGRPGVSGTTLVVGDFVLSAGWGDTATVSSISGSDSAAKFTVNATGIGQGANPTITLTFSDGAWTSAPRAVVVRNGGDQLSIANTWTSTTTTLVITLNGTPVQNESFTYEFIVVG